MGEIAAGIYVDQLMPTVPTARWRWDVACHLFHVEYDLAALDRFAVSIGMRTAWRHDAVGFPHYDLHRRHRSLAVKAGAIEVDRDHPAMRAALLRRRQTIALVRSAFTKASQ